MKMKTALLAALLLPTLAAAQYIDPATGQRYDQYGRPIASVQELCREGQMAGGPVTAQCAEGDYLFNRSGERLGTYDFKHWGYNVIANRVTESEAMRLNNDPAYRARYIKEHGIDKHPIAQPANAGSGIFTDEDTEQDKEFDDHTASVSALDKRGVVAISDIPCKTTDGYVAQIDPGNGKLIYGCADSYLPRGPFKIVWSNGTTGMFNGKDFVQTEVGQKALAEAKK